MTSSGSPHTIRAQDLLGREVRNQSGKAVGRVYDLETKRVQDELCVAALLVGERSWLTRFGWSRRQHGKRIAWGDIVSLTPSIVLRSDRED